MLDGKTALATQAETSRCVAPVVNLPTTSQSQSARYDSYSTNDLNTEANGRVAAGVAPPRKKSSPLARSAALENFAAEAFHRICFGIAGPPPSELPRARVALRSRMVAVAGHAACFQVLFVTDRKTEKGPLPCQASQRSRSTSLRPQPG